MALIGTAIIYSCNPVKYIPEGDTLLDKNHISINNESISKAELEPFIRQKPNKEIFGAKFHLGLYNLSNIEKTRWPHGWLREIGEEPVVYDPVATERSSQQLQSYIASKGYFDSRVSETVEISNRKSKAYYNIDLKTPYTIRNLNIAIPDSNIKAYFTLDDLNCLIKPGDPYDMDVLDNERKRFERVIRDMGYYGFSSDHITFRVDSTVGNRKVDITYIVKNFTRVDRQNRQVEGPHPMYRINNIYIYPDFVPRDALEGGEDYLKSLDTTEYKGYYFVSANEKPEIKYDLIIRSLFLKSGSVFNMTNTDQTQSHLLALKTFRLVNIFFGEPDSSTAGNNRLLDCTIQLTLLSQQSFRVEVEGTNSAGNLGGALNFIYQHKNLLRGAELFNLKLKGAYEALSQQTSGSRSSQEYGIETSLRLPRFLIPIPVKDEFIREYNPTTSILGAYNYQSMPLYTRSMANASFGYNWNASSYTTHFVTPFQLNQINLLSIDEDFEASIQSSYLAYSYRDVMIMGGSYSLIFNNQSIRKIKDYWFIRFNAEAAGNIPSLIGKLTDATKIDDSYNFLGQPFAQYVKADFDFRYNIHLNEASSVVYRGFAGVGIPYGNSRAMPFEKQYFGGGANGIRAWQVRTLGPGTYVPPDDAEFLNQTADLKLEANAEYRFKLFWILEGALFVDAGNIWTINRDEAREGSQFRLKSFINDMAVGAGTGLRFDLNFVMFRADLGMKLRDPWLPLGSRWIISNRPYNFRDDFAFVIAIGYPF